MSEEQQKHWSAWQSITFFMKFTTCLQCWTKDLFRSQENTMQCQSLSKRDTVVPFHYYYYFNNNLYFNEH